MSASVAYAQAPTLAVSQANVVPGAAVTVTITGAPGDNTRSSAARLMPARPTLDNRWRWAPITSSSPKGCSTARGRAVTQFTPGFRGSVIDRAYLQVATSPALDFVPVAVSAGQVLRNNDLVSGLGGPAKRA